MSTRATFVLGLFLFAAAVAHGGFYAAGHDFVVNRFTGAYEFVPSDEVGDEETRTPIRARASARRCLDLSRTRG